MARKVATFDHLTKGRIALHIITGKSDAEQEGDGDFSPKDERYRRASEYLAVMRRAWTSRAPFDFDGAFYKVRGAQSDVHPLQPPYPQLLFGGASEGALAMGAEHCDTYAMYAEPLAAARARIAEFRARAAAFGRTPGFNISARPILGRTEGEAWDKANAILASLTDDKAAGQLGWKRNEGAVMPVDNAGRRLMGFALEKDVHDARLWMPITRATGALGNTSALVGTAEQVADALLEYYKLGVHSFLIRGFDPVGDTTEFGRELIPRLKAGALGHRPRLTAGAGRPIAAIFRRLLRTHWSSAMTASASPNTSAPSPRSIRKRFGLAHGRWARSPCWTCARSACTRPQGTFC